MGKLYETTHRGSYSNNAFITHPKLKSMNTYSEPPTSNKERSMPNIEELKDINYFSDDT